MRWPNDDAHEGGRVHTSGSWLGPWASGLTGFIGGIPLGLCYYGRAPTSRSLCSMMTVGETARILAALGWLIGCLLISAAVAGEELQLDADPYSALPVTDYRERIPTPEQFFGGDFRVGQRPLFYHELVAYLDELVRLSPRIRSYEYARSHGGRSLRYYVLTSPVHQRRLDQIIQQRQAWCDPRNESATPPDPPLVIVLAYSIHGNEASGANAVPLVAYHLVAGRGKKISQLLKRCVILVDPCLNPDGYDRFVSWVSQFRGKIPSADPFSKEHRESWPGGRTNYYWFDLNRDWLVGEQPESAGRLVEFHRWKPNLLFDFHEMNSPSTFFLQPGIPARKHPLIPDDNVSLTAEISKYPGRLLDAAGAAYFTEDVFDDFYPGKGSTYIDLHGGVGILFEQGTTRGAVRQTDVGTMTFAFTVRNQVLASVGALEAALALEDQLVRYQRHFYTAALEEATQSGHKTYLLTSSGDPARMAAFSALLRRHNIQFYPLATETRVNDVLFAKSDSIVVPVEQPEYRFLRALVERRTEFQDNTFYDVSAWCLVDALGLKMVELSDAWQSFAEQTDETLPAEDTNKVAHDTARSDVLDEQARYVIVDWRPYYAPRTLQRLLRAGVPVRVAMRRFSVESTGGRRSFDAGALVIPVHLPGVDRAEVAQIIRQAQSEDLARIGVTTTALTPEGPDFGSLDFPVLRPRRVAIVVGQGVQAAGAGEMWYLMDHRFGVPVTLIDVADASQVKWANYDVLIFPAGRYDGLTSAAQNRIRSWIESGGTLIALGTASSWLSDAKWGTFRFQSRGEFTPNAPFGEAAREAAANLVTGAILQIQGDETHPLAFGVRFPLAVMRNHNLVIQPTADRHSRPLVYSASPRLSGYLPRGVLSALPGTPAAHVESLGGGRILALLDAPSFRGHWYGSDRLFWNAVFFAPLMDVPTRGGDD